MKHEREREMREAMSCLHAPDDLYERVVAQEGAAAPRRRRGHALPVATVAALVLVAALATAGGAYAVASSGFAALVWGDHGLGDAISWNAEGASDGEPATWTRQFGGVDPSELPAAVTDAVQEVDASCTGNGYTLTVHELLVDENGTGAVTFSLGNPAGVALHTDDQTGELALDPENERSLDSIRMNCGPVGAGAPVIDASVCFDRASQTDTAIDGVLYFTTFGTYDDLAAGVSWSLCWHTGEAMSGTADTPADIENFEATTDVVVPQRAIPVATASDGSGATAWLGPLSVRVKVPDSDAGANEFICDYLAVTFADGSQRVIWDADAGIVNHYHASVDDDGSISYALTQYLPADEAVSVTVRGRLGSDLGPEQTEHAFELAVSH